MQPILVNGQWQTAQATGSFVSENPSTQQALPGDYPISSWADIDACLNAATTAAAELAKLPAARIAQFLETYAALIEAQADAICELAHSESGLPIKPRLRDAELPRTVNQLRQAATAARTGTWANATIDRANNIRSCYEALGPVWVFGPNNFPLAFNSVAGGDFAAAIAAGNPVIAKANTSHPGTTKRLAELALEAACATNMPAGTIQLIYRTSHSDGVKLVSDPRTAAIGYTGSRSAGLTLKQAADAVGKPIYLELSSVNPVVILPGAITDRGPAIADEYSGSCLMGAGQFCTNPGLLVLLNNPESQQFVDSLVTKFQAAKPGTLLTRRVQDSLAESVKILRAAGAELLCGGETGGGVGCSFNNTLLRVTGSQFLAKSHALQTEAFGNVALIVMAANESELLKILEQLEGNLTGTLYSHKAGQDDALAAQVSAVLRRRVGRLLNDKMPTGVAVSPAMNHGGPFPATGHPGFTAVGIPASIHRFAALQCYDNVRPERLPALLRDANPTGETWRWIDGVCTKESV
jgi:2,5-dioxopentanoate dehydrogenase